jgi:putative transposase
VHLIKDEFYHIYNRGNNQQLIFFTEANYLFFIQKIRGQLMPVADIIAYCLMPNHFHIIIRTTENSINERKSFGGKPMQEFAYRLGLLQSSYAQAINKQNQTSGSLFQQKSKVKILSEEFNNSKLSYLENCVLYLHQNPVAANLVNNLIDWQFSSYPDYAGKRNGTLCNKELFYEHTGLTITDLIYRQGSEIDDATVRKFYE